MSKQRVTEQEFVDLIVSATGRTDFGRGEVQQFARDNNVSLPCIIDRADGPYAQGEKGRRNFGDVDNVVSMPAASTPATPATVPAANEAPVPVAAAKPALSLRQAENSNKIVVPHKDPLYVPFGEYSDIIKVMRSKQFFPIFVTGLSGNGKTMGITQAAAKLNRPLVRVNFTVETDEDDLIGGFRLIDGDTVFVYGPVIEAMKQGAICVLDEVDLGGDAVMCMQSIMEGSGYYIKKTGEYIEPKEGFNIIATANTKGQGDSTGKFVNARVMNEAFLERFPLWIEQEYPSKSVEKKILGNVLKSKMTPTTESTDFIDSLVTWADSIRTAFFAEGSDMDDVITTRRLVMIITAYTIFNDKLKSVQKAVNRFDSDVAETMMNWYKIASDDVESATVPDEDAGDNGEPWKSPNF